MCDLPADMQRDILVAVDQSDESQNALVNALDIVSSLDGTITVVHAVDREDHTEPSNSPTDDVASQRKEQGKAVLSDVTERAAKRDISIETELLVGEPVETITHFAEQNDIDVIYVGHRGLSSEDSGLSGESRGPLGSVAKGLIEHTHIPVSVFDRTL